MATVSPPLNGSDTTGAPSADVASSKAPTGACGLCAHRRYIQMPGARRSWAIPALEAFATGLGRWRRARDAPRCDGYFNRRERRIALNPAVAVNQQAAALVHELAHALVRLDHQPEDPEIDYASEESVAFAVCGFLGL